MVEITQTCSMPVGDGIADNPTLFSVNEGVPLADALAQLAKLLDCAQVVASELCDAPDRRLLGVTVHCIEGALAPTWVARALVLL